MDQNILDRQCINGNATDYAFIKFAEAIPAVAGLVDDKVVMGIKGLRDLKEQYSKESDIPFNSAYKFMTSVRKTPEGDTCIMKGASDFVFDRCSTIMIDGEKVKIDEKIIEMFADTNKKLGKMGERVIAFAYREIGDAPEDGWLGGNPTDCNYTIGTNCMKSKRKEDDDALCFLGLMSLIDPPREAVPNSVKLCRLAGVKVIMVTGDHPVTAAAIAKTVHIMDDDPVDTIKDLVEAGKTEQEIMSLHASATSIVVPGWEVKEMTEEDIAQVILYDQVVFARTSPAQKLRIVKAAQSIGHVVAVTGDGVNDSPALKAADIGCAMGIAGTDVAKEAADMILLSDDFSAIVNGVEEGRLIFDNLKKSIAYTLSSNIPEISPFLMSIIFNMPISLTTILILCVDLGTDMIPAISLAYEKAESDIMQRPPRDASKDRLVTTQLIFFAYFQIGVFQALAGFYSFFVVLNDYGFRIGSVFDSNPQSWFPYSDTSVDGVTECPCGGGYPQNKLEAFQKISIPMYCGVQGSTADGIPALKSGSAQECSEVESYAEKKGSTVEEMCTLGLFEYDANWPYGWACPYGTHMPEKKCKFSDNDLDGGNACYKPAEALAFAQTAAFVSIVIVQWADLIICKTRSLSLYQQGMSNSVMLFGLCSETLLCCILCYMPGLGKLLNTRMLRSIHWMPSMPYSILIFLYDETRKYFLRRSRVQLQGKSIGFVEKYSYY